MDALTLEVVGKGNKVRVVPFSQELRKVLWRYLNAKVPNRVGNAGPELVFCCHAGSRYSYRNAARDFKKMKLKVGLPRELGFHQLRHSFATGYLRNGGDVVRLSKQLGHSSVSVTMRYVHLVTDDLREAQQRLSPLSRLRR
jgi:integrase/recombinase XerD